MCKQSDIAVIVTSIIATGGAVDTVCNFTCGEFSKTFEIMLIV
jgi:hypothetical protein